MSEPKHFAICVQNGDYAGALELRKVYELIDDAFADSHHLVRVIDESGEDYLYPSAWFARVIVPAAVEELLHDLAAKAERIICSCPPKLAGSQRRIADVTRGATSLLTFSSPRPRS